MTPEERRLIARIGAHVMHATHDSRLVSQPARDAFMRRFADEVDPDRKLPEAERERRAEHAKRAYFQRLALRSARARRGRRGGRSR